MLEVEEVRDVTVDWRMLSLAYLNLVQRRDEPPSAEMRNPMAVAFLESEGYAAIRVCAAARRAAGDGVLGPLYTEIGRRIHLQGRFADPTVFPESLAAVGLPERLADAATSPELDPDIVASHHEAFDDVGIDVGAPVIRVDGRAFFGPALITEPTGEAAGRLWDGFVLVTRTEGFYEIKRTRGDRRPVPLGAQGIRAVDGGQG